MTTGSSSTIVIPDEEDIGPTADIHSPIEASACLIDSRKRTLRDGEGSATWDGTVKIDGSTWRYGGGTRHGWKLSGHTELGKIDGGTYPLTRDASHHSRTGSH